MNAMQPPQSIEEIKAGLETTEKGGVRQSIRNCLTVFQRDPLLSGAIAYNILTDRKDIIKPIGFHRESTALNDTDMKYLLLYLEETYGLTNEKKIDNAIGIVANENKYHPIRDYLNTLVWDGTERIRFCLRHFLGADADDYTYEALKLFLLGAISRAFQPGCKFEIMLCLVGGQGAGKSTFFRLLAVRDEWFSDDLRKLDDDNVYRKLQGHWIIEMSEMMATANAKSIEEIKSFLSRQKEVYKIPYETHPADRPRQCVFGGTSNALDFLPLDHSGSIRLIKQHYPDIIIVGNKQTFGMIEGFYGVTGEQYMVKDEDFLALGHHKLRFYMTPMVHWPETMMTFDETEGVLFSGDGFGCFGTLDGGFLDTRMNLDKYWDEMVRYYSNIVGKYGSPVQKALAKLGGLPISTICSTHGPVWTDNIAKVIGIYDRLSRYAAEEGVVIVYGSMYGNTEQMAEAIAAELSVQGIKNIVMHNVSKSNPSYIIADIFKYRGLIIGSPTYSNQIYPEIESLLSKILVREVKGRYLGYFGSFCWAGAAVKRMGEFAEKSKFEIVGDPVEMKQAMKDITYEQCENLARAMAERLKKDRQ